MTDNNNVTLVTAFMANVNSNKTRALDDYIELGVSLLNANINKVVFIDDSIFDAFININYNNENTKIIPFKKESLYLYDYKNNLDNFNLATDNYDKDTYEYMFTICGKTEWVRMAIDLNIFNSDQFVWVDFGIKHVFHGFQESEYIQKIERLNTVSYDNVRIGSIWDARTIFPGKDIFSEILWYFAGGVFGGSKNALGEFADLTKKMCISVIENKKSIMWEVNIWYLVYLENSSLFDFYTCDHNHSLIDNY